jgi:glutamate/tyrosine decarboxylase-like PLP-dependent enzyme
MQSSEAFQGSLRRLRESLKLVSEGINDNTVPFWSPRYTSHMVHEPCMPAIMGYLTGMLCNQNNIIAEASPFTTLLESEVGMDLCRLVGFQTLGDGPQTQENVAWGHITSGGTVANLESLW